MPPRKGKTPAPAGTVIPPAGRGLVTAYGIDLPAGTVVTPRQSIIALLQVSWQRWQILASMVEDQITNAASPADNGVVGHVYALDQKNGTLFATSEQVRALIEAEAAERDRCARLAKQAHDMGIDDSEWLT
jgi:hypothetical protein